MLTSSPQDLENSRYALSLLQGLLATGNPLGRVFPTPCSVSGCQSFSLIPGGHCPLHNTAPWQNADNGLCPNCFLFFGAGVNRHHCRLCGGVFCGDCTDYQVLAQAGELPAHKPHKGIFSEFTHHGGDRRACITCSSLMDPNLVQRQRVTINPAFASVKHAPLDLVFCFDGTASMHHFIHNVESNIDEIVDEVHGHHYVDLRMGALCFRDHAYGDRLANIIPFQNHHRKFDHMIEHIKAGAAEGNDTPEALAVGLAVSQALAWRPGATKLLIVITDAPAHGFGMGVGDSYPNGDPTGLDPRSLVEGLRNNGITVYTVGVEPHSADNGGDKLLVQLAQIGNGRYIPLQPHHHLHHFLCAATCELLIQKICGEEIASSTKNMTPEEQLHAIDRVFKRMKTRTMPRFSTVSRPGAYDSYEVHRTPLTADDIRQYAGAVRVTAVSQKPGAAQAFGGQAQPFGAQTQPGAQPFGQAQPYGAQAQPGVQPFGQAQPFGVQAQPGVQQFGGQAQPFVAQSQPGAAGQPFGGQAQQFGAQPGVTAQPFGGQAQPFGAQPGVTAQPFGGQAQPFGAQIQPGVAAQPFGGQAQPLAQTQPGAQPFGGQAQPGAAQPYGGQPFATQPLGTQQQFGAQPYGVQPQAQPNQPSAPTFPGQ